MEFHLVSTSWRRRSWGIFKSFCKLSSFFFAVQLDLKNPTTLLTLDLKSSSSVSAARLSFTIRLRVCAKHGGCLMFIFFYCCNHICSVVCSYTKNFVLKTPLQKDTAEVCSYGISCVSSFRSNKEIRYTQLRLCIMHIVSWLLNLNFWNLILKKINNNNSTEWTLSNGIKNIYFTFRPPVIWTAERNHQKCNVLSQKYMIPLQQMSTGQLWDRHFVQPENKWM